MESALTDGMRRKRCRPRSGFSLIEVLVSLTLVFIALIGVAEVLVHALQAAAKAETVSEMTRAAVERLERSRIGAGAGGAAAPEPGTPGEGGALPFTVESRRGNFYLGSWTPAGPPGEPRLRRWNFEILSELEPEAVLEFTIFFSRELGF